MTKNRARKTAIRARKATTSESYTTARRAIIDNPAPSALPTLRWGVSGLDDLLGGLTAGALTVLAGCPEDGLGRVVSAVRAAQPGDLPTLRMDSAHVDMTGVELAAYIADYAATTDGPALVIIDAVEGVELLPNGRVPANVALLYVTGLSRAAARPFSADDIRGPMVTVARAHVVVVLDLDVDGSPALRVVKSRAGLLGVARVG